MLIQMEKKNLSEESFLGLIQEEKIPLPPC